MGAPSDGASCMDTGLQRGATAFPGQVRSCMASNSCVGQASRNWAMARRDFDTEPASGADLMDRLAAPVGYSGAAREKSEAKKLAAVRPNGLAYPGLSSCSSS